MKPLQRIDIEHLAHIYAGMLSAPLCDYDSNGVWLCIEA